MTAYVTSKTLAEKYGLTPRYFTRLAASGVIPGAYQPSGPRGGWRFDTKVVGRWAAANGHQDTARPDEKPVIDLTLPRKPHRASRPTDAVYLIYSAHHIKIGVSSALGRRSHSFKTASPAPLHVLCELPGSTDLEGALHRQFSACRRVGEWFKLTPELRAFIEEHQSKYGRIELEFAEQDFRRWLAELDL